MTITTDEVQVANCIERLLDQPSTPRLAFGPGETVFEAGTKPESLAYVHRGRLHVYHVIDAQRKRLTRVIGPGDWTGIDALADAQCSATEVVAVEKSVVSIIPAAMLLESIGNDHDCAVWLVRAIANRASAAEHDAALAAFEDCRTRLVGALRQFSQSAAATAEPQGIKLRLTHSQLADAIGAARETVSLMLSEMRRAGVLRTGRNHLVVDLAKLPVDDDS